MLFDKNKEYYSAEVMESPLDLTERSLISKRDQVLERASKRAHLTKWKPALLRRGEGLRLNLPP